MHTHTHAHEGIRVVGRGADIKPRADAVKCRPRRSAPRSFARKHRATTCAQLRSLCLLSPLCLPPLLLLSLRREKSLDCAVRPVPNTAAAATAATCSGRACTLAPWLAFALCDSSASACRRGAGAGAGTGAGAGAALPGLHQLVLNTGGQRLERIRVHRAPCFRREKRARRRFRQCR